MNERKVSSGRTPKKSKPAKSKRLRQNFSLSESTSEMLRKAAISEDSNMSSLLTRWIREKWDANPKYWVVEIGEAEVPPTAQSEAILAFPEVPLLHAAAGEPVSADSDTYAPTRQIGADRFAVQLHGDSMSPRYPNGSIVILRERDSLKKPLLKKGEIYLFDINGEKTLKVYTSRVAKKDEVASGVAYTSPADGKIKVRILKSLNPAFPEIPVTEDVSWLGWLDKDDN